MCVYTSACVYDCMQGDTSHFMKDSIATQCIKLSALNFPDEYEDI